MSGCVARPVPARPGSCGWRARSTSCAKGTWCTFASTFEKRITTRRSHSVASESDSAARATYRAFSSGEGARTMEQELRLLILEDVAAEAELAVRALETAGLNCDWRRVEN